MGDGEGDGERDAATDEEGGAERLGVGERDAAGFAVVIPAEHAARDSPAAQAVTVAAIRRMFIGFPVQSL